MALGANYSDKERAEQTVRTNEILASAQQPPVNAVFLGQRSFKVTWQAAIPLAIMVIVFLAGVIFLGVVPLPGGLLIAWFVTAARPRRVIGLGGSGLALMAATAFRGRPKKFIRYDASARVIDSKSVQIAGEKVILSKDELAKLNNLLNTVSRSNQQMQSAPIGSPPPPFSVS